MPVLQGVEYSATVDGGDAPIDHLPQVHLLLAAPRGFCAGVRRAIDAVRDAIAFHGPPVYVRRAIVHNLDVVRGLEEEGAIFVEELDEVPTGSVVILSAHGVSLAIAADAERRGFTTYDAVCPLVAKIHREVERHERSGRRIILIGHKGHPEIDGTLGRVGAGVSHVVQNVDDVRSLPLGGHEPAAYAVQTTYAVDEAQQIVEALRAKFSDLAEPATSDICYATTNRQGAIRKIADAADAIIVAGEGFSSNANRLAEVASQACGSVQLVAGASDIDWTKLASASVIGVTAAASTPESAVEGIIAALSTRFRLTVEEVEAVIETTVFKPLAIG